MYLRLEHLSLSFVVLSTVLIAIQIGVVAYFVYAVGSRMPRGASLSTARRAFDKEKIRSWFVRYCRRRSSRGSRGNAEKDRGAEGRSIEMQVAIQNPIRTGRMGQQMQMQTK